jgi:hypothetical protein
MSLNTHTGSGLRLVRESALHWLAFASHFLAWPPLAETDLPVLADLLELGLSSRL